MTAIAANDARSAGDVTCIFGLLLTLCVAPVAESVAQSIEFVTVGKHIEYVQTSATDVKVNPTPPGPGYGGAYGFSVNVEGENIGGITAPTFTGPINVAAIGSWYNGGKLLYNAADGAWRAGFPNANDWGSPTINDLNSKFGSGTYIITVNGISIPFNLTGDAYPNPPLLTLGGGGWSNGKYVINPGSPLTITTSAFAAYGSHAEDHIGIGIEGFGGTDQLFSMAPATNFLTYTLPASTFVNGQDYHAFASFDAVVDLKPNSALPGSLNAAFYSASTGVTISAAESVVEFYNASFDHYFITWVAAEIDNLDSGRTKGWTRTGLAFKVYTATRSGTSAVCRIYIPPGKGDGHYFGRDKAECDGTMTKNPTFILESGAFFFLIPPNLGNCGPGTVPVYRVFSNRADANHRYTTDRAVRDAMVVQGWLAEGDGADTVVMCAPQ